MLATCAILGNCYITILRHYSSDQTRMHESWQTHDFALLFLMFSKHYHVIYQCSSNLYFVELEMSNSHQPSFPFDRGLQSLTNAYRVVQYQVSVLLLLQINQNFTSCKHLAFNIVKILKYVISDEKIMFMITTPYRKQCSHFDYLRNSLFGQGLNILQR